MAIIDTHTHLFSDVFKEDQHEMMDRALTMGVTQMLLPNIDVDSIDPLMSLVEKYPASCKPMMGLHPGSVKEDYKDQLNKINEVLVKNIDQMVAVGEIGMDLYWDKTFIEEQKDAFRTQIAWAKEYALPIVIHAREAFEEIFEIIDELNDDQLTGVFHCFTGTEEQAKHVLDYGGFKLGIGGVVTYKKSHLPEVLTNIPIEHLVLETDSPYLPPVPYRGKRNESAHIVHVAEKLSEIYGMSMSEVNRITTTSAKELFKV